MSFKSHFKFNKQERSGIFFLLLIIILLQVGYFVFRSLPKDYTQNSFSENIEMQEEINALQENFLKKDSVKLYPFNPNYITDYRGYTLGMSVEEIDRLHAFREKYKYVNSKEEFQKVTFISDSLLKAIAPYFKFPEWTKKKELSQAKRKKQSDDNVVANEFQDLNTATAEDFRAVYGIGEKLSNRIVKFRNRLGGFLVNEQLYDVYGLEPMVVERALIKFKVINQPEIEKINVTWASYNDLRNLLYISDKLAKSIIEYRKKTRIKSLTELKKLDNFPKGKFERVKLYLTL